MYHIVAVKRQTVLQILFVSFSVMFAEILYVSLHRCTLYETHCLVYEQDPLSSWYTFQGMRTGQLMIRERELSKRDWVFPMVTGEATQFWVGDFIL